MEVINKLSLSFIICLSFGCKQKAVIEEIIIPEKNEVVFFVDNYSDSPIRIRFFRSMADSLEADYYAYQGKDTLTFPIYQPEVVLVSHKSIYSDTLYVTKGDSIRILLPQSGEAFQLSGGKKSISTSGAKQTYLDSLYRLFMISNNKFKPMEINSGFEKINLGFPIKLNAALIETDTATFSLLIDGLVNKLLLLLCSQMSL